MNGHNLHELINRYEANLEMVNGKDHFELFKWQAIKHFHDVWHSDRVHDVGFARMFAEARRETSIMIDNSRKAPTSGIVKMAEKEPERVERLFREVLLADDGGDIARRQRNYEAFMEGIEATRQELFPAYWKYKQERNDVIAYLVLIEPEKNYLYRYNVAESFSRYIEYGSDIGSGKFFRLELYYQMCDQIVEALRQHPSLLEKHEGMRGPNCYQDSSLHIMAFDLMYCSRTYGFYEGLQYATRAQRRAMLGKGGKAAQLEIRKAAAAAAKAEKMAALGEQIEALEDEIDQFSEISLVGVSVWQKAYGEGIITRQEMNKIWVDFSGTERAFTIHRDYIARPTFEDDEEIVGMLTEYGDLTQKLADLRRQLDRLME